MGNTMNNNLRHLCKKISLLVLDVDGVLTDGRLYFNNEGDEIKAFDSQDGHGIKMLQASGVMVAIITGRQSALVVKRAQNLGIQHLYQGREDKQQALSELLTSLSKSPSEVAYVGDDLPDLGAIEIASLGIAVANADSYVQQHADWVTQRQGGRGAVREICEQLMDCQGTLTHQREKYHAHS